MFDSVFDEFLKKRPNMQKFYNSNLKYYEYINNIINNSLKNNIKSSLKYYILEKAKKIYSSKINFYDLKNQLTNFPIISFADHHGLLNYNLLYNSNILFSEIIKDMKLPYIIVLATGRIPLKNPSFPRGFYFKNKKFNFFCVKDCKTPVCIFDNKIIANKKNGIKSFILNYNQKLINSEEEKFLDCLFFNYLNIDEISNDLDKFSDQISFLNNKLWKYYFNENIRNKIPNIIYLQSNQIILDILIEEIENNNSIISLILFDPKIRDIFLENFNNVASCWGDNFGSHLFWGISDKKNIMNLKLDKKNNSLVGKELTILLEKDSIIEGLLNKKILPTNFIDLLIITFLGGYITLGGFNQLEYLPQMQQAHVKSLREIGMNDLADEFATRVTDGLICGLTPFKFDSGIDLIWHYNSTDGKFNGNLDHGITEEELEKVRQMKLKDLILSGIDKMMENINA